MGRMGGRPRGFISRAIVFVLAGAIVNIAVAWGCSIWSHPTNVRELSWEEALGLVTEYTPPGEPVEVGWPVQGDGFGMSFSTSWHLGSLPDVSEGRCGWPTRCLRMGVWIPKSNGDSAHIVNGIRLSSGKLLPLRPIWPGFAINTLFYAAIVFAAPVKVRRRRRIKRGLCPNCAYPIGAGEICSECGQRLPVQANASIVSQ